MQTTVEESISTAVAGQFTPAKIMARLLLGKLKEAGLRLSTEEKKTIQVACEQSAASGDWSTLNTLALERRGRKAINLTLTETDANKTVAKMNDRIQATIPKLLADIARRLYGNYLMNAEGGRLAHIAETERFKTRLARTYGAAFRALGRFLMACVNTNQNFLNGLMTRSGTRRTAKRLALVRLHHRACRIAIEIECLLHAGLGDAALARWRTLHEVCVSAVFIGNQSNDVATRFLKHEAYDRTRIERLAFRQAGRETTKADQTMASLRTLYGKPYTEDFGWASKALKKERVRLTDLENATKFGQGRLPYLKANSAVHSSALALFYRPGMDTLTEPGSSMEWAISSNIGLSGPADLCAWSLLNTSVVLLNTHANADNIVLMQILCRAKRDVSEAFNVAERRIMKRHEKLVAKLGQPARQAAGIRRRRQKPKS